MNINDRLLVKIAEQWLKISQTTGGQPADFKKALAPLFGLIGDGQGNYTFDVNSKAADTIFGLMDKFGYKGKVDIYVKVSTTRQSEVIVKSMNPKLSEAIKGAFQNGTAAAIKNVPAPGSDLLIDTSGPIVTAQNAK